MGRPARRQPGKCKTWSVDTQGAPMTRMANFPGPCRAEHAHQRRRQNWPFCAPHPLRTHHRPPAHTRQHLIPRGMQLSDATRCSHARQHYRPVPSRLLPRCRVGVSRSCRPRSWSCLLWADGPEMRALLSIEPQRSHARPSDVRYAPFHRYSVVGPPGEAEPLSLAMPLADRYERPSPNPKRASDLLF